MYENLQEAGSIAHVGGGNGNVKNSEIEIGTVQNKELGDPR